MNGFDRGTAIAISAVSGTAPNIGALFVGTAPAIYIEECSMLMTLAIILIVLWALGMVSAYTMGGLIHILLVIAIVVVLVRVIQGRKVL